MNFWRKRERGLRLVTALDIIRANPNTCDFEVRFSGQVFRAHRAVLMASSDYFESILARDTIEFQQGFVEVSAVINAAAFKKCLEYLYTGEITIDFNTVEGILRASRILRMKEIDEICFDFLKENLRLNKTLYVLSLATVYDSPSTVEDALKFVIRHYAEFIETDEFKASDIEVAIELLRSVLSHPTEVLWRGVVNWIEHDIAKRNGDLIRFLEEIKQFNLESTLVHIFPHPLVSKNREATKFIVTNVFFEHRANIWRYLDPINCFLAYNWTQDYNSDQRQADFLTVVLKYMKSYLNRIFENDQLVILKKEDFATILASKEASFFCETVRWKVIINWMKGDKSREADFDDLFPLLDLRNMSVNFLQDYIRPHPLIQRSQQHKDLITDEMFLHTQRKTRVNSCLLFDNTTGHLHCHYPVGWQSSPPSKKLVTGTLLGGNGEGYILKFPKLYKIRPNGAIETKQSSPIVAVVKIALIHSGVIYVFHELRKHSTFDLSHCKWRMASHSFDIPEGTGVCSTEEGMLFLGGGDDGKFTKLYDPAKPYEVSRQIPPMQYGRSHATCAAVGTSVFLVRGQDHFEFSSGSRTDVQVYSFKANSWSILNESYLTFADNVVCCCGLDSAFLMVGYKTIAVGSMSRKRREGVLQLQEISAWEVSTIKDVPMLRHAQIAGWTLHEM